MITLLGPGILFAGGEKEEKAEVVIYTVPEEDETADYLAPAKKIYLTWILNGFYKNGRNFIGGFIVKRKDVQKCIIVISLLITLVIFVPMLVGCKEKPAATSEAPAQKKETIKWRLQSYAGPALNEYVVGNAIDEFNIAANGEMFIQVYTADELVPHGELFRALQEGTVDAVVSDDDSMASPVEIGRAHV